MPFFLYTKQNGWEQLAADTASQIEQFNAVAIIRNRGPMRGQPGMVQYNGMKLEYIVRAHWHDYPERIHHAVLELPNGDQGQVLQADVMLQEKGWFHSA